MEPVTPPTTEAPTTAGPTPEQKLFSFSPRADITPLEAAHVAFLLNTAKAVVNLEEHPSWPLAGRHFELMTVPVSVEGQAPAATAQPAPVPKRTGRRKRWPWGRQ